MYINIFTYPHQKVGSAYVNIANVQYCIVCYIVLQCVAVCCSTSVSQKLEAHMSTLPRVISWQQRVKDDPPCDMTH